MRFVRSMLLMLFLGANLAWAEVTLPSLFSDHAVLQRSKVVPIWGKAIAGEEITVVFGTARASTRANAAGRWQVVLDLADAPRGALELTVEGTNRLSFRDVVVGEVWLCSGQSNMEWSLAASEGAVLEVTKPRNPYLRQFLVKRSGSAKPLDDCEGSWIVADPHTVGRFSGVAYFFGKALHATLQEPIGVINASAGGSIIESWMSAEAIANDASWQSGDTVSVGAAEEYSERLRQYAVTVEEWMARHGVVDQPTSPTETFLDSGVDEGWRDVRIDEELDPNGLPEGGAIWLRRKVRVPHREAVGLERGFQLSLGVIKGADTVYWNNQKIGGTFLTEPGATGLRRYQVPTHLLERGSEALLSLRLFFPWGGPSLKVPYDPPFVANTVPLDGVWQVKVEYALPSERTLPTTPFPSPPERPRSKPSGLFNGMIAPLIPYAIRGMVWYQGESNVPRAETYTQSFSLMVEDWRRRWGRGDFPVLFCQLPNYRAKVMTPSESGWAVFREQQARCLQVTNTGMAIAIDLGAERELHPRKKRELADRLAKQALARSYGHNIPSLGPDVLRVVRAEDGLQILFRETTGGLVARALPATHLPETLRPEKSKRLEQHRLWGDVEGFAVCGEDRRWYWGGGLIDGDSVIVSSPQVPRPIAVRYAWGDNPTCNLYNGAGFPAAPFHAEVSSPR